MCVCERDRESMSGWGDEGRGLMVRKEDEEVIRSEMRW